MHAIHISLKRDSDLQYIKELVKVLKSNNQLGSESSQNKKLYTYLGLSNIYSL